MAQLFTIAALAVVGRLLLRDSRARFEQLRESRDALAAANARLMEQGQARERIEGQLRQLQKMEAIGQLTGGIAHDFNNMLTVILASIERAQRRLITDPDAADRALSTGLEGAKRAATLTARLLAFARQQPLRPEPVDPSLLVAGMTDLVRRTIGEHVQLETVLAEDAWTINVDPQQLEQAILNLCVNARDAVGQNGRVTIETTNVTADAGATDHAGPGAGDHVLISVSDNGVGMPKDVIERAFEPFFSTKGPGHGTGLGLSQVYGFARQSDGHALISSEPGQGAAVHLYLPRYDDPTPPRPAVAEQPQPSCAANGVPVLLVEDQDQVREVVAEYLRELGCHVVTVACGGEALEILQHEPGVRLVVTDLVMPGMTGRELASKITAWKPDVKVLYMTGYDQDAIGGGDVIDVNRALIQKPFSRQQLALKLRHVLDA